MSKSDTIAGLVASPIPMSCRYLCSRQPCSRQQGQGLPGGVSGAPIPPKPGHLGHLGHVLAAQGPWAGAGRCARREVVEVDGRPLTTRDREHVALGRQPQPYAGSPARGADQVDPLGRELVGQP
ncbi:hypothetical protein [Streptomyces blattellae]|uniref:hypothetical protein n=1 Tax=Streptomyces blattellae TaxID=2569855 RepID=UPI0012B8F391|nr:hypothetical protein [Streptomyces blattellae]